MENEMNAAMTELVPEEFINAVGGNALDEVFRQYMDYVDSLYAKYGCRGKGLRHLKTLCTPEELSEMNELWEIFRTQPDR